MEKRFQQLGNAQTRQMLGARCRGILSVRRLSPQYYLQITKNKRGMIYIDVWLSLYFILDRTKTNDNGNPDPEKYHGFKTIIQHIHVEPGLILKDYVWHQQQGFSPAKVYCGSDKTDKEMAQFIYAQMKKKYTLAILYNTFPHKSGSGEIRERKVYVTKEPIV